MKKSGSIDLSLVIPVHNALGVIDGLYSRIKGELNKLSLTHEIIFVDDGSTDGTVDRLKELKGSGKNVKLIVLNRKVGDFEATIYGVEIASGTYILTMDSDAGYDASDILRFVIKIQSGFDVVYGWRKGMVSFPKGLTIKIANAIVSYITGVKIHDTGCSLKGFRRRVLDSINLYSDMYRFFSIIAASMGARVGEVEITYREKAGNQKGFRGLKGWKAILDIVQLKILVDFSARPNWFFGLVSLPFWITGAYLLFGYFYETLTSEPPSTIVIPGTGILFTLLATSLTTFGFLLELVVNTGESKKAVIHAD